jgi:hypothetical protein
MLERTSKGNLQQRQYNENGRGMITYPNGKKLILAWLQKRYNEKNQQDFIFKASYIARDMKISNQQVGHMLCLLEREGIINRSEEGKKSANRWTTQFNTSNRKSEINVSIWSVLKKILRK